MSVGMTTRIIPETLQGDFCKYCFHNFFFESTFLFAIFNLSDMVVEDFQVWTLQNMKMLLICFISVSSCIICLTSLYLACHLQKVLRSTILKEFNSAVKLLRVFLPFVEFDLKDCVRILFIVDEDGWWQTSAFSASFYFHNLHCWNGFSCLLKYYEC